MKAARDEFLAVAKLLNRSSINSIPSHFFARNLSTSICLFEKQKETNQDQAEKSSSDENKSAGSDNKQSSNNDDEKRKKDKKSIDDKDRENDETNKAMAYLTKTILWCSLIYSVLFTIYVVLSILSGERNGGGDSENYTISWKEFVQYMLASGEVKEIIVRPQYEYVRVVLHEGAIINGRRPRFSSYMLTVPNIERFEQRIREIEKSMGIAEGLIENFSMSSKLIF